MIFIVILVVLVILFFIIRPYIRRYDTVIAYTGGLGTGKSFLSTETAEVQIRKARSATRFYNFWHWSQPKQPMPELYSSIPVQYRVGLFKKRYALKLLPEHLTLQLAIIPGSVVFLDEIDVFCNQYGLTNPNIIDTSSKKELLIKKAKKAAGEEYADTGLVDEEIRLFRHLYTNMVTGVEPKLIVNSQATSNIVTVIRRRMNTVFVLSTFRKWGLPFLPKFLYTVKCRNITITDEITNTSENNSEDNMRLIIGFLPLFYRRYNSHCYHHRADGIPFAKETEWQRMTTERLLKCPLDDLHNKSKTEE